MGPYLAVIKDSFREAMASRVLWVLLVVITLVLLVLAPFGFDEQTTTRLRDDDLANFGDLMKRVKESREQLEFTPARRVWDTMDSSLQNKLLRFEPGKSADGFEVMETVNGFIRHLNSQIHSEDFYEPKFFEKTRLLSQEGLDLKKRIERGEELQELETARFHRLLMEASFPDVVKQGLPTSLRFRYFTTHLGPPFPISRSAFNQQAKGWAAYIMKWFVGVVGVVVAILVTASIIPQMFDPGSLHLLLSNPVSRSLLFLSKFIGGCAFTFLSAAYLIGGLWLLLGVRFGIWEVNLLYSIPLYVFVFAIYYAVSALAGAIWRNPLISIAFAILFWLVCLAMGYMKFVYENFALNKTRFHELIVAGDDVIGMNEFGIMRVWDAEDGAWEDIEMSEGQRALQIVVALMPEIPDEFKPLGPVYDPKSERLVNIVRDMQAGGALKTTVRTDESDWEPEEGVAPPSGMIRLLMEPDGGILAVSSYGLYRLEGDPLQKQEGTTLFGIVPLPNTGPGPYRSVGPAPAVILTRPYDVTVDPITGDLVTFSRKQIKVLKKDAQGKFAIAKEIDVEIDDNESVRLAATGGRVLLGRDSGPLLLYDANDGSLLKQLEPEKRSMAKWMDASPDGETFAIAFANGNLWLLDAPSMEAHQPQVRGQGDISAVLFRSKDQLMATYQSVRVGEYDVATMELTKSYSPGMGALEIAYRYVVYPAYYLFPKPSELDRTIDYTLASEDDAKKIDSPLQPVWSSLLFILVVLAISCVYIERQEF